MLCDPDEPCGGGGVPPGLEPDVVPELLVCEELPVEFVSDELSVVALDPD